MRPAERQRAPTTKKSLWEVGSLSALVAGLDLERHIHHLLAMISVRSVLGLYVA